jgi:hypothetical protein
MSLTLISKIFFKNLKKQKNQKTKVFFFMHFSHSHAHFIKFWIFQTQKNYKIKIKLKKRLVGETQIKKKKGPKWNLFTCSLSN